MCVLEATGRHSEADLERLAIFGSEQERLMAAELLRLRGGLRKVRGKLGMFDPVTVRHAWVIVGELLGEE